MIEMFCPTVKIMGTAANIVQAKALIDETNPELVFLDVEMPGGSGFDLLQSLGNVNFRVVFTTAHAAYAIKAIKYAAMDYLLKPISIGELKGAINKLEEESQKKNQTNEQIGVLNSNWQNENFNFTRIALPTPEGLEFFETKNIVRCEADRAYCMFYLNDKRKIHISKSMSGYEDILTQANFLKVHKSSMVNLSHVKKYIKGKGGFLVMSDGSNVDVAMRRKDAVMQALKIS
jgi:two-component system LytT family response regulator